MSEKDQPNQHHNPDGPHLFHSSAACIYTACYCEENVWQLCKSVQERQIEELDKCFCIFISSEDRTIPLWCQKASKREDGLVVWDYHVIFVHKTAEGSLVYDLDTLLEFPCEFSKYVQRGIQPCYTLKPQFHRKFRVIPARTYLGTFASDRTHMLDNKGDWMKPPPTYPCIQTESSTNNIQDFINMDSSVGVGTVMTYGEFCDFFTPVSLSHDQVT